MSLVKFDPPAGTVTAVLGPTNTGKTHYAIERMLARESGIIGLPLRLLAREVYDRIVALRGAAAVSLITGEEKIAPPRARYHVCTVEAMPLGTPVDFVAVDEIQLCTDPDRGHVFTDRLLRARGRYETLFMGSDTMRSRIGALVPGVRYHGRTRFSNLSWSGSHKLSRLKPRTAIVAFSVDQVYAIAELIRRQRGGAAVVMGALSPRTRNAQVALYQEGDVDYMVATDAIGMGLNMDVDHVAFAGTAKFDGGRHRALEANELAQIAGRAGRYMQDGTFGTTGEAPPLAPETIMAIEEHQFRPVGKLMWRNHDLRFHSVEALLASLDHAPDHPNLMRAREAEDQAVLRALWEESEIRKIANRGDRVRLLWDVCQIPDFRKVSPGEHATLVGRIYRFLLSDGGCIPSDWLTGQIARLDRVEGDIDDLSRRLAFIRTWTYVANRAGWVEDAARWREETRAVEDRLSDALHEKLTQRFVDRRTSVLMRRLKQKERLVAEVNDKGEVTAEGHFLGQLSGFRFSIDETASGDELKTLRSASLASLGAELSRRADRLYLSPDSEIDVTEQGGLMWGTDAIGRLTPGDDALAPKISVFVDDMAGPDVAEKVERRLRHWLGRRVNELFEPMLAMRDDETITGLAKGVAFRLAENFGIIARREIAGDIKALEQADRAALRKHGVRFGQHFIFMPALLKPAPTGLRLLLWSLAQGLEDFPDAPPPGHVTVPVAKDTPEGYYHMAGYRPAGRRAVRIDMLERLADLIRPMDARAGFEATPDMLSITGLSHEAFADLMAGLGYRVEKGERPKEPKPARAEANQEGSKATGATDPAAGEPGAAGAEAQAAQAAEVGAEAPANEPEALPEHAAAAPTGAGAAAEIVAERLPAEGAEPAPASEGLEVTEAAASATAHAAAEQPEPEAGAEAGPTAAGAIAAEAGILQADPLPEGEADPRDREKAGGTTQEGAVAPEAVAGSSDSDGDGAPAEAEDADGGKATASTGPEADKASEAAAAPAPEITPETGPDVSATGASSAADASEPGEVELETYYIFRFQPRHRGPRRGRARPEGDASTPDRASQPGRDRGNRGEGAGEGARARGKPRNERQPRSGAKHAGAKGDRGKGKGPKGRGQRPEGGQSPRTYVARPSGAERARREVDPDNPFAVLQQLKKN